MLASEENLLGLTVPRALPKLERVVLDMDRRKARSANRKAAPTTAFRVPLLSPGLNSHGDCLAAKLRPGNVHSAEDWEELLLPEIERQQNNGKEVAFRGDAAFAKPDIYEAAEERGVKYAIRLPANENLRREVAELLVRPVGRPSRKPLVRYKSFLYRAASWSKARRVVAKVEHHAGELFPRDNSSSPACEPLALPTAAAEQWIKEGKQATHWTRLSCHRGERSALQLSVLA